MKFDKNSLKTIGGNLFLVILITAVIVFTIIVAKRSMSEDILMKKDITYNAKKVIEENRKLQTQRDVHIQHIIKDIHSIQKHLGIEDESR